uniref:Transposase (Putative), gypsy type n=1 Tax=Tanacetum cinerariifolium TaxID=118510 RepID=A0A6L2LKD4_TANCI|nr:hypothetical protein [Tanacetum cinerariifolium]
MTKPYSSHRFIANYSKSSQVIQSRKALDVRNVRRNLRLFIAWLIVRLIDWLIVRLIDWPIVRPIAATLRDTVQLETAVITIFHEYLLEFTLKYDIPETLHPALPGPEDRVVDFLEGKIGVYTRLSRRYYLGDELYPTFPYDNDWGGLIRAPTPTKVKVGSHPRALHEVPLLTLTANRVIKMDDPATVLDSSGMPPTIERSSLDFSLEIGDSDQGTAASKVLPSGDVPAAAALEPSQVGVAAADPSMATVSRKRGRDGTDANDTPKSLRRDHADPQPSGSSYGGKSLAAIQLGLASTASMPEDAPTSVNDPDPLCFADPSARPSPDVAQSSPGVVTAEDPDLLDTPEACQDLVDHVAPPGYFSELRHMQNEDFLGKYNVNLARQVALRSQLRLRFEQEAKLLRKSVAQVARRDKRIVARELEIKNLEALLETEADMKRAAEDKSVASLKEQVSEEEKLKAAFKEFKRYEDKRVEQRCAELDACLDALSIDFDEELYPHMLTAIAGRRWVVGHGLHLAMMKCAESLEMGQAFVDVVSAGSKVGGLEGCTYGCNYGCLISGERHWEDAPQYISDLHPSSSQLTIPVYPEVGWRSGICTHGGPPGSCPFIVPNVFYAPWESWLFSDVLDIALRTRSLRPLGLQPAYAADHVQRYMAPGYSRITME